MVRLLPFISAPRASLALGLICALLPLLIVPVLWFRVLVLQTVVLTCVWACTLKSKEEPNRVPTLRPQKTRTASAIHAALAPRQQPRFLAAIDPQRTLVEPQQVELALKLNKAAGLVWKPEQLKENELALSNVLQAFVGVFFFVVPKELELTHQNQLAAIHGGLKKAGILWREAVDSSCKVSDEACNWLKRAVTMANHILTDSQPTPVQEALSVLRMLKCKATQQVDQCKDIVERMTGVRDTAERAVGEIRKIIRQLDQAKDKAKEESKQAADAAKTGTKAGAAFGVSSLIPTAAYAVGHGVLLGPLALPVTALSAGGMAVCAAAALWDANTAQKKREEALKAEKLADEAASKCQLLAEHGQEAMNNISRVVGFWQRQNTTLEDVIKLLQEQDQAATISRLGMRELQDAWLEMLSQFVCYGLAIKHSREQLAAQLQLE